MVMMMYPGGILSPHIVNHSGNGCQSFTSTSTFNNSSRSHPFALNMLQKNLPRNDSVDITMEYMLANALGRLCYLPFHSPPNMVDPLLPPPSPSSSSFIHYLCRFLVHFTKGIFVGAGMYTMDMLLVTGRLIDTCKWFLTQLWTFFERFE